MPIRRSAPSPRLPFRSPVVRLGLSALLIAGGLPAALAGSLNTAIIAASTLSLNCLEYRVVGICYWLFCGPHGCKVRTSAKVRHYIPDVVVSSYAVTGNNPWTEIKALGSGTALADGGGSGTTNDERENNLAAFKNVDVIGHPGTALFNKFAGQSGYVCKGAGTPLRPYLVSTLDVLAWRYNVPESLYPEALIPGTREIGSRLSANLWGSVYPRGGFLHQADDHKAAAVMAQRAGDVVTRKGQPHVYSPLLASSSAGYWPAGALVESDAKTGKWQELTPFLSQSCAVFPQSGPLEQDTQGDYAWTLWRPYTCCKRRGQTFLGSTDFN